MNRCLVKTSDNPVDWLSPEGVRRRLGIVVDERALACLKGCPADLLTRFYASMEDMQRMLLMAVQACCEAGMTPQRADKRLLSFENSIRRCGIDIENDRLVLYWSDGEGESSESFVANYYGQMQLYQKLEALFS